VLVPAFLAHGVHSARARLRSEGRPAPWGSLILRHAVLPGCAVGAVCAAVLAVTFFQGGGGMPAVTWLFEYHKTLDLNHSSLLSLLTHPDALAWFSMEDRRWLSKLFSLLQVVPAALLGLLPLRTTRALLLAALAATLGLVIFPKFFSPQWLVLWAGAIGALLAPRERVVLGFVALFGLLVYLQTPLFFFSAANFGDSRTDAAFWGITYARAGLMLAFWIWVLARTASEAFRPAEEPSTAPGTEPLPTPARAL
jgi:hypothetical protein